MSSKPYGLVEQVKAAIILQPDLLKSIFNRQGTNKLIFNETYNRLLPVRTSVEIEHLGDWRSKLKIKDYSPIRSIDYDYSHPTINNDHLQETKISISNWSHLSGLYHFLKDMIEKCNCRVDTDGSIHIHVDISSWINKHPKGSKGMFLLKYGANPVIIKYLNEILDTAQEIGELKITPERFNFNTGFPTNVKDTTNARSMYICDTVISQINSYDELYSITNEKRNTSGVGQIQGKRNWINIRYSLPTIEIRTFPCSLDYEKIIVYMINANRLAKRILQIAEYLGHRANAKNNYLLY